MSETKTMSPEDLASFDDLDEYEEGVACRRPGMEVGGFALRLDDEREISVDCFASLAALLQHDPDVGGGGSFVLVRLEPGEREVHVHLDPDAGWRTNGPSPQAMAVLAAEALTMVGETLTRMIAAAGLDSADGDNN